MLIVWGTKLKKKNLGTVADYCRVCHEVTSFDLVRIGRASHLYFLSLGQGTLVGHTIQCRTCGLETAANANTYSGVAKRSNTPLKGLVAETHPDVLQRYAARLELDKRARRGQLSSRERASLIRESIGLVNAKLESRPATTFDLQSGLAAALTAILPFVALRLFSGTTIQGWAFLVTLVVGALATLFLLATGSRRFAEKNVYPLLAKSLAIISPTEEELDDALAQAKAAGQASGRKHRAGGIAAGIAILKERPVALAA